VLRPAVADREAHIDTVSPQASSSSPALTIYTPLKALSVIVVVAVEQYEHAMLLSDV